MAGPARLGEVKMKSMLNTINRAAAEPKSVCNSHFIKAMLGDDGDMTALAVTTVGPEMPRRNRAYASAA